jgi:hypothetical protein
MPLVDLSRAAGLERVVTVALEAWGRAVSRRSRRPRLGLGSEERLHGASERRVDTQQVGRVGGGLGVVARRHLAVSGPADGVQEDAGELGDGAKRAGIGGISIVEGLDEQLAGEIGDLQVVEAARETAGAAAGGGAAPGAAGGDGFGGGRVVEGAEGGVRQRGGMAGEAVAGGGGAFGVGLGVELGVHGGALSGLRVFDPGVSG